MVAGVPSLNALIRAVMLGTLLTVYALGKVKSGTMWRSWKSNVEFELPTAWKGVKVG